jgi:hypothetical protein
MSKRTRTRSKRARRRLQPISPEEAKLLFQRSIIKKGEKDIRLINKLVRKTQSERVRKPKRDPDVRLSKEPRVKIVSIRGVPVEGNEDG